MDANSLKILSPSHLLQGRTLQTFPPLLEDLFDPNYLDSRELRIQYAKVSQFIESFKSMWESDYLTALRAFHYGAVPVQNKILI